MAILRSELDSRRRRGLPTKAKAGEMLQHGSVKGNPLTSGQRGLFGMIRGGATPKKGKFVAGGLGKLYSGRTARAKR